MSKSSSDGLPHPEEFPISSPESRAAARALLDDRFAGRKVLTMIINLSSDEPRFHETPCDDGTLWRVLSYPSEMTILEALRSLGIERWKAKELWNYAEQNPEEIHGVVAFGLER